MSKRQVTEIMDAMLWIVIGVFAAFVIVAVVFIARLYSKSRRGSEIHISGGANIERGYLSNDNNYFKGGYGFLDETVVLSGDLRAQSVVNRPVCFSGVNNSETFCVNISDSVILGRAKAPGVYTLNCDVSVSKMHCRISRVNGGLVAEDLGSLNHTYVNSKIITTPCRLNSGDMLRLGNAVFRVDY